MRKIKKLFLPVFVLVLIGSAFIGYTQFKNDPVAFLESPMAEKVIASVVENIDTESIDLDAIANAALDREVIASKVEEFGLSGLIDIENLTDADLEKLRGKVLDYLGDASPELSTEVEVIPTAEGELQIHYIDVGQGDSTLIKYGDKEILIDCAEDDKGTLIQNYLQKQGVDELEYLILTHFDSDHIGSADVIVTKFDIDEILVTDFEKSNATIKRLNEAMKYKRYEPVVVGPGHVFYLEDAMVEIIGPVKKYEDSNDSSLVVKLTHGSNSFLFMGDAEEKPEEDLLTSGYELDVDVLKVGHHGSSSSSSKAFIEAVTPEYAVISCGEGNEYGHPHAESLNNLRAAGTKLYRTDEQGSIVVTSDGTNLTWNAAPTETWQSGR